jgi:hypothetical protein
MAVSAVASASATVDNAAGQKQGAAWTVSTESKAIRGPAWEDARALLEHHLVNHCRDDVRRAEATTTGLLGKAMRAGCPPETMRALVDQAWSRVYGRAGVENKAAYLVRVLESVLTVARIHAWDAARVAALYDEQQKRRKTRR